MGDVINIMAYVERHVNLTMPVTEQLNKESKRSGLTETDIVNRAITFYAMFVEDVEAGKLKVDRENGIHTINFEN